MNTKVKNLLFIVEKIGPYHNSRFNYLSKVKEFKIFVIDLLQKLVEQSDNELDDKALAIVKKGLGIE